MDTDAVSERSYESIRSTWGAGIAGGFVGGIAMGIVLHAGANTMEPIGALYGWPTVLGGWIAHLVNSVVLGVLFALIVSRWNFHDRTSSIVEWSFYGAIYAAAVGLVTGGIMVPIAIRLRGAETLPDPILPVPGVVGGLLVAFSIGVAHLVYGVLLGAIYGHIHSTSVSGREPGE